jgi:hypothetical protein
MERELLIGMIEGSDLDGLVRMVDRLSSAGEWRAVRELIDRSREAVERGKQVWGAADYGEYRLARDAPGDIAATVVKLGAGRFSHGPLWEVAASTHTWDELAPYIDDINLRTSIAQERVLRGEVVPDGELGVLEIPLRPLAWEPVYPVPTYREDGVDVPGPDLPDLPWVELGDPVEEIDDPDGCDALLDVVRPWLDESSGRGQAIAVAGPAEGAIRALGPHRVRAAEIDLATAVQLMAWAGATGGAYGRRRGTPTGRTSAWWALACLLGLEDEWPLDGVRLGAEAGDLRWLAWDPGDQVGGWVYHLAVEDPQEGLAWAVSAVDAR